MANKKIIEALNSQIQKEFHSSYIYIGMEAWFADNNLDGFSNFFHIQAMEERDHAYKIFDFVHRLGGTVNLEELPKPKADYKSVEDVIKAALEHEQFITKSINELMDIALDERDHATISFLNWFIDEQVEEEENVGKILNQVKLMGKDGRGIFMIDRELAKRVYNPPVAGE